MRYRLFLAMLALLIVTQVGLHQARGAESYPPDVARLISLQRHQNDICRGGSGDDPATLAACNERESYGEQLFNLGWCYGNPTSPDEASKHWQRCVFAYALYTGTLLPSRTHVEIYFSKLTNANAHITYGEMGDENRCEGTLEIVKRPRYDAEPDFRIYTYREHITGQFGTARCSGGLLYITDDQIPQQGVVARLKLRIAGDLHAVLEAEDRD